MCLLTTSKIKVEKGGTLLGELQQGSAFGEKAVLGMMSIQLVSIKAGLKRKRDATEDDAMQYRSIRTCTYHDNPPDVCAPVAMKGTAIPPSLVEKQSACKHLFLMQCR